MGIALGLGLGITFGNIAPGSGASATVPGQFQFADWSVADAGTGNAAIFTITGTPDDGGSPFTAFECDIDGGSPIDLGGVTVGNYPVTNPGFVNDVLVGTRIRAVNAQGAGPWSNNKAVTPTGP